MISSETEKRWSMLMSLAQKGDAQAYKELLNEVAPVIRNFVRRRAAVFAEGDDVVQEVLLAIHQSRHTYSSQKRFSPWMFAIARYKVIDHLRALGRKNLREVMMGENLERAADRTTQPANGIPSNTDDVLNLALETLKPEFREVIRLTKFEGLSTREAAKKLSITESALKVRAHRAYAVLRKKLEKTLYGRE